MQWIQDPRKGPGLGLGYYRANDDCNWLAKKPSAARRFLPTASGSPGGRIYKGDKSVRLWELTTGKRLHRLDDDADALAFSPDGKTLFTGSSLIRRWDVANWETRSSRRAVLGSKSNPSFSPRRRLACAATRTVRVWETATGKLLHHFAPATEWVSGCAFSPDGTTRWPP